MKLKRLFRFLFEIVTFSCLETFFYSDFCLYYNVMQSHDTKNFSALISREVHLCEIFYSSKIFNGSAWFSFLLDVTRKTIIE